MIRNFLLVGLGGALGSMLRFGCYQLFKNGFVTTLFINILGSLVIGCIIGICQRDPAFEKQWRLFLATGICGGFTTFSAFSMENIELIQQGKFISSTLYILVSIIVGLAGAWAGYKLTA